MLNKLKLILNPKKFIIILSDKGFFKFLNDKMYLSIKYRLITGKKLSLEDPKTFNEKIQWLKLYDREEIYTTMVDKYETKIYVANIIGKEYIIPTLGVFNKFDDIDFDKLPNKFVIKCTHDSGGLIVCRDKLNFNIGFARKKINRCLKKNYYYKGREWPYKNIKPRIIIEQYIENSEIGQLRDYKFFCFNGKPELMYLSEGFENRKTVKMSFFDMDYKLTDCKRKDYKQLEKIPDKPKSFEDMKKIAAILSKGIPHLRVDFYEVDGHLYFGELTFYTHSGYIPFEDERWNIQLGKKIILPNKKGEI